MEEVMPSKRRLLLLAGTLAAVAVPAVLDQAGFRGRKGRRREAERHGHGEKGRGGHPARGPDARARRARSCSSAHEAGSRKFSSNEDFDPALITQSAEIVRDFINNYHEKSEEEHVFPAFKRAELTDLVDTLLRQHEAGRRVTATILKLAPAVRSNPGDRKQLVSSMQSFITMYRPHAAREDTDLFPRLKDVVSSNEVPVRWQGISKRRSTNCSEKTASRRWRPASPSWSSKWAFTI